MRRIFIPAVPRPSPRLWLVPQGRLPKGLGGIAG